MSGDRQARQQKTAALHLAMEAADVMARIRQLPHRATGLAWFEEILLGHANGTLQAVDDRPLVGTTCVQVPDEIIHACGGLPIRLCSGAYAHDQVGAEILPARSCPLIRATTGRLQVGGEAMRQQLAAVVIPTTCDQKRKLADLVAGMGYPVLRLEMPATKEGDLAREYWQESIRCFAAELSRLTGQRLTVAALDDAINQRLEASRLFRRLQAYRQGEHPTLYGVDLFLITGAFSLSRPQQWCAAVDDLLVELEDRRRQRLVVGPRRPARILFTGSPAIFPNLKVPLLLEEAGGLITADESCAATRLLHDVVAFAEARLYDMLPALADRALKPCTCPCLTPNLDRQRALTRLAHDGNADGIVSLSLSGCMPYEMEQRDVVAAGRGLEMPVLCLESDYSPEDSGQLATRVEAFLESIRNRKRRLAA